MVYCTNCGAKIDEKAIICPSCGVSQQPNSEGSTMIYGILGFFIPFLGIILFFALKNSEPKKAKSVVQGALLNYFIKLAALAMWLLFAFLFSIGAQS